MTLTAPYRLTADDESWARASFCWALLDGMSDHVDSSLSHLSSEALAEVYLVAHRLQEAIQCEHLRRPMRPSVRLWPEGALPTGEVVTHG